MPEIADVPEKPPAPGTGRLLIATEGGPARVARVTSTWEGTAVDPGTQRYGLRPALEARKMELLCLTPCAVDVPTGADDLVFSSLADPQRTSIVELTVPHGTTVVRHALGTDRPYPPGYVSGLMLEVVGVGAITAAVALLAPAAIIDRPESGFTTAGAAVGIAGVGALVAGIVMATQHRGSHGPGATTTFRVP